MFKKKKKSEKSWKIKKGCKKVEVFVQNMFFRQTIFSLQKNHLFSLETIEVTKK